MRVSMIDPSLFTLPYDNALAEGLVHAGHEVTLYGRMIGPDDNDLGTVNLVPSFYRVAGRLSKLGLPRSMQLAFKGLDHIWSMTKLLRLLRQENPDIIHFQWLPLPFVDKRLLSRFRQVAPLILTVHDTNPFNGDPSSRIQAHGVSECFPKFDRLFVHTQQGVKRLLAHGIPERKLILLPHGRPDKSGVRRDADTMQSSLTFLLFGKIKPYKGVDVLIEAFSRLPSSLRQQARVRIVGKPYMDLSKFHQLIDSHGIAEQVSIEPTFIADADVPSLFGPGVISVFPYRELEASGVLSQALGFGRPVIASTVGVFSETLQDGVQGHLVPPDDVDSLTAAMAHMIEDRDFTAGCARAAVTLYDQSEDWLKVAQRTAETYASVGSA